MSKGIDDVDRAVLGYLQEDGRVSNAELARRVELSPPGLQKRLRKLEKSGVITGYTALISREAVGLELMCFVQITLQRHEPAAIDDFRAFIQTVPEVLECHHTTGEFDYLIKILVQSPRHLERFLVETLTPVPSMDRIRTSLVLREVKNSTVVPLSLHNGQGDSSP